MEIEDINDNPPVFEKSFYSEECPYNDQTGVPLATVSATDADSGENGFVGYTLTDESGHFRIDITSGINFRTRFTLKQGNCLKTA